MRISGGTAKGRKVGIKKAFLRREAGDELRPTPAKVRAAVFNILTGRIEGAAFLDLYAGTGAVGLEALSRGAGRVVFVEENNLRANIIKDFVDRFGFREKAMVVRTRVQDFLRKNEERFTIIFLDPPYTSEEAMQVIPLIDELGASDEEGIIIAEHSSRRELGEQAGELALKKKYKYGDTALSFYKRQVKG
ncbi:MAG TPA: 16S rRNA (guanine(966)-N(2))-methyltransferase RsmD [Dissulfurispiraceae bacterium]|nr:16S rRNA (guanine(966)-N(2))-methyltransferase RsmD [Dissulfurispiraceae bacterium]